MYSGKRSRSLLLLGHSDGTSTAAGGLRVLTTHTESPHVTETSVVAHLLQTVKVLTDLVVDLVGQALHGGSVLGVLHSVQEPRGHLEVLRLGDDLHDTLHLFVREGTCWGGVCKMGVLNASDAKRGEGKNIPARRLGSTLALWQAMKARRRPTPFTVRMA